MSRPSRMRRETSGVFSSNEGQLTPTLIHQIPGKRPRKRRRPAEPTERSRCQIRLRYLPKSHPVASRRLPRILAPTQREKREGRSTRKDTAVETVATSQWLHGRAQGQPSNGNSRSKALNLRRIVTVRSVQPINPFARLLYCVGVAVSLDTSILRTIVLLFADFRNRVERSGSRGT